MKWCAEFFLVLTIFTSLPVTLCERQQLLVILLDGFRWDYLDAIPDDLGGFKQFLDNGVKAEYVEAIFPSISYPSWTTLSTGLYPENHGILGNYFYDKKRRAVFDLFNNSLTKQPHWWQLAEPIWTTATLKGLRVATILWSRSDVPVNGIVPEEAEGFQSEKNWTAIRDSLDKSLGYLEEGYDLVMMYGEHIDNLGHEYGPGSPEVIQALKDVGRILGDFLNEMNDKGLTDKVNIMIVSDHGMTPTGPGTGVRYINIDDYLNVKDVEIILDRGAFCGVFTQPGRREKVYTDLQGMRGTHVYKSEDIPKKYHYGNNSLIPDLLITAEPGFFIQGAQDSVQVPRDAQRLPKGGTHGYRPLFPDMRTILLAKGPNFQMGVKVPPISLVDIYQIYTHILEIPAKPHNGTWEKVQDMFSGSPPLSLHVTLLLVAVSIFFSYFV